MIRGTMLVIVMMLSCDVAAQTVQKCVARDGHVRYQSEPCARGERVAEVWDATPDEVPAPEPSSGSGRRKRQSPSASTRRASTRRATYVASAGHSPDSCEQARAWRDAAERRAGLRRNYDLLSTLDARVFEACR